MPEVQPKPSHVSVSALLGSTQLQPRGRVSAAALLGDDHDLPCLNCVSIDSCRLKLDKNFRFYTVCRNCNTRTFMRGRTSLAGYVMLTPLIHQLLASLQNDASYASNVRAELDRFASSMVAREAPAESAQPAPVQAAAAGVAA